MHRSTKTSGRVGLQGPGAHPFSPCSLDAPDTTAQQPTLHQDAVADGRAAVGQEHLDTNLLVVMMCVLQHGETHGIYELHRPTVND